MNPTEPHSDAKIEQTSTELTVWQNLLFLLCVQQTKVDRIPLPDASCTPNILTGVLCYDLTCFGFLANRSRGRVLKESLHIPGTDSVHPIKSETAQTL